MIFHRHTKSTKGVSKLLRVLGVVGIGATSSLGLLASTQAAAHTDTYTTLVSNESWLNVGVRGGS